MASKSVDTKTTLRQLMKQEKQKRIDSPLAKYTSTGQLYCALCNQQLTSETFWKAHVNGREHKQKIIELKSNVKQTNTQSTIPPEPVATQPRGIKRSHDVATSSDTVIVGKPSGITSSSSVTAQNSALPADFFDSNPSKPETIVQSSSSTVSKVAVSSTEEPTSALPEGFFDDPQLDARIRKVEYVDKMETEWEAFTREMKQQTNISEKIEANDDVEREFEREIIETDELIDRWQRIEQLHDIKDSHFKVKKETTQKEKKSTTSEDDDEIDDDLEKELEGMYNWRQKRS